MWEDVQSLTTAHLCDSAGKCPRCFSRLYLLSLCKLGACKDRISRNRWHSFRGKLSRFGLEGVEGAALEVSVEAAGHTTRKALFCRDAQVSKAWPQDDKLAQMKEGARSAINENEHSRNGCRGGSQRSQSFETWGPFPLVGGLREKTWRSSAGQAGTARVGALLPIAAQLRPGEAKTRQTRRRSGREGVNSMAKHKVSIYIL